MNEVDISLYAILDPSRSRGRPLPELARAAVAGGVTLLQYRDKRANPEALAKNAAQIGEAVAGTGVPLIVNDDPRAARLASAQGVHLGGEDMHPELARGILGEEAIIGLTVKTTRDARSVALEYADYVCIGGVFATVSKDNPTAIGLEGWKTRAEIVRKRKRSMPVGAISGISFENVTDVILAGADGIAVIGAILMADDVEAAARRMAELIAKARAKAGGRK